MKLGDTKPTKTPLSHSAPHFIFFVPCCIMKSEAIPMAQEADIPLSAAELEVCANENNVCILKNGPYSLCTLP